MRLKQKYQNKILYVYEIILSRFPKCFGYSFIYSHCWPIFYFPFITCLTAAGDPEKVKIRCSQENTSEAGSRMPCRWRHSRVWRLDIDTRWVQSTNKMKSFSKGKLVAVYDLQSLRTDHNTGKSGSFLPKTPVRFTAEFWFLSCKSSESLSVIIQDILMLDYVDCVEHGIILGWWSSQTSMEKGPHMQKHKQAEQHLCHSTKAVLTFCRSVRQYGNPVLEFMLPQKSALHQGKTHLAGGSSYGMQSPRDGCSTDGWIKRFPDTTIQKVFSTSREQGWERAFTESGLRWVSY